MSLPRDNPPVAGEWEPTDRGPQPAVGSLLLAGASDGAVPTAERFVVTLPAEALDGRLGGAQVLVTRWSSGQLEADVCSPGEVWTPVEHFAGSVRVA